MSTPQSTTPAPNTPPPPQTPARTEEYDRVRKLQKQIGAKTPWMAVPEALIAIFMDRRQRAVDRVWAWLVLHTLAIGRLSPYAIIVDKGGKVLEAHLAHCARELEMDPGNVRRAWRELVAEGRARNGTAEEGPERLYICGDVPEPVLGEGSDSSKNDRTDPWPEYISKEIKEKGWSEERVAECRAFQLRWDLAQRSREAEAMCQLRREEKALYAAIMRSRFDLTVRRDEPHAHSMPPEMVAARESRMESLSPVLKNFVQTSWEFVQTGEIQPYKPLRKASTNLKTAPQPLSPLDPLRAAENGGRADPLARPVSREPRPGDKREAPNQQPAPPALDPSGQVAAELMFAVLAECRDAYPDYKLAMLDTNPENAGFRALVYKAVRTVGADEMPQFCAWIKERLREPSLGKTAGLGLICDEWAKEFARLRPQREAARQRVEASKKEQQAKEAAEEEDRQRKAVIQKRVDFALGAMTPERREELKARANAEVVKKYPAAKRQLWTEGILADQIDWALREIVRAELEKDQPGGGGGGSGGGS